MDLILLRHAKAEERSAGLADEERKLTAKGRKRAQAVAKGLAVYLRGNRQIEIWASQAVRSRQTAAIVAETLGAQVTEHPAVYGGSLEELIGQWRDHPAETIVIVGHEPHLSIWAQQLARVTIPFKKCTAAGFTLLTPDCATLEWYASPKILAAAGEE
ncbi:MAG: histidine phosphatase family protein [Negativicutes bacterium]|nr:histidine phosphatase family protein [Negativicutes bacterium]